MRQQKKKNKRQTKPTKRLVLRFDAADGLKFIHPSYSHGRNRWKGVVAVEYPSGLCNEYDFSPSSAIPLQDFVRGLRENIALVSEGEITSYELRVYRTQ